MSSASSPLASRSTAPAAARPPPPAAAFRWDTGIVVFETPDDARNAIQQFNGGLLGLLRSCQARSRGSCHVGHEDWSGRSRGYGFVAFRDRPDAEKALSSMDGEWLGLA
ncbi:hypothetical protein QBC45DRAFT_482750 [Copromyces sp. CBS 386.78]|nr:hypothetical protein QBC45DRAFT_482750 [Copromyces sp. CBS 386.78]